MPFNTVPGPMQTGAYSVGEAQIGGALDKLDPILALPSRRETFDPQNNQRLTYQSKQQLFNERYQYLETYFQGALFDTPNAFMTQQIFPHRRYDDIYFRWDYVHFPAYPAVRTAQGAPPVKITYEMREGSATMHRYSLAVEGSDEDQRTAQGQMLMGGLLASCSHAFLSTFELNGFRALFRGPAIHQKFFFESQLYDNDANRKMQIELASFDIVRRSENGFATLADNVRAELRETQQLDVTDAIIPTGLRSVIARSQWLMRADIRGAGNQQFMDLQGSAPALQNNFAGVNLHVARTYYFDGAGIVVNPLSRTIMIGDYTIQDDFVPDIEPAQYSTSMTEPAMFSVNDNGFQKLPVEWLLEWNNRFDKQGNLRVEHYEIAKKNYLLANDFNVPAPEKRLDMFIYATETPSQTVFNVTSHWGHMETWALMPHIVDGIAETSAYRIGEMVGAEAMAAIDKGVAMMRRIRNKIITPVDRAFMYLAAPSTGTLQAAGNNYGAHSLPTAAAVDGIAGFPASGYLPAGYGTVSGMLTIGEEAAASETDYGYISEELRQVAAEFAAALPMLKEAYGCIYPDHPALQARFAPSVYRSSDTGSLGVSINSLLAFGYNIVDELPLPLYLRNILGVNGGAPPPLAFDIAGTLGADYTTFRTLPRALAGAPLVLRETLGNERNFRAFETEFGASKLADEYKKKLDDDKARAATRGTTRTTRTVRTTRTADDEDDDAAAVAAQQSTLPTAFQRFYENVVTRPGLSESQTVRLLSNVVENVRNKTSPSPLTNAILNAWINGSGAPDGATGALQSGANSLNNYYLTRLAVPYERLIDDMQIASPINNGRSLARGQAAGETLEQLRRSSNVDLDLVTFSQARAGFRTQAAGVPTAGPRQTPMFGTSTAGPTIAQSIFVDAIPDAAGTGKTLLVPNENMRTRWKNAGCTGAPSKRIAAKMFITAPITKQVLLAMAAKKIRLPFAHIIMRPHKRYMSEAIIFLSITPSEPIGFTATHDPRVNYVSNGTTEKFFLHVVLYTESVNTKPENVIIVPDARISGYLGGDNLVPFTPQTYDPKKIRELGVNGPSVIIVMQPAGSLFGKRRYIGRSDSSNPSQDAFFGPIFDIRGYFGRVAGGNFGGRALGLFPNHSMIGTLGNNVTTTAEMQQQMQLKQKHDTQDFPHYSSALHTNYLFRFNLLKAVGRLKECRLSTGDSFDNTIVLQARTKLSLTYGSAVPTAELKGIDHFSDSTEDGGASRRNGVENEPYTNIYAPLPSAA